jgi:hypothetical protein
MKRFMWPLIATAMLILGLLIGFFVGRAMLEHSWSNPVGVVSPKAHERSAAADADPTPPVGAALLAPLPLRRLRSVAPNALKASPLRVTLTSFGNGEAGAELHIVLVNDAPCVVTEFEGIAYAYDARGRAVRANKAGEYYVAFSSKKLEKPPEVAPGAKFVHAQPLKFPETASLGYAHVDAYKCKDGTSWRR